MMVRTVALVFRLAFTEIVSNCDCIQRVGPRFVLPTMVTLWGVACTLQGVLQPF